MAAPPGGRPWAPWEATGGAPPPPPPYIGLGQREARVNRELLFNKA